jgi:phosphoglycerate dehydrogenase-like enzyme
VGKSVNFLHFSGHFAAIGGFSQFHCAFQQFPLLSLASMSWKVLITARTFAVVGKPALEFLEKNGCELILAKPPGPCLLSDLLPRLQGVDATLCSPDQYNSAALCSTQAAGLKMISRWGVGYDTIDIAEATRQGIVVAYTPGILNETVADWTWALLLAIARRVPQGSAAMARGEWINFWGHDIHGKTLGLIGCGRIGQAVARRAAGFNMRVIGYDIVKPPGESGIEFAELDELLAESDFVSLHAALTPENRGMIGEAQLRRMKPSAYLINTARGSFIKEEAMARALHEGWIAGAALDVFTVEPLPADSPLRKAPNLLLEPHQASFSRETGERVSMAAAEAIVELMNGRKPRWVVNEAVFSSPNLRARIYN